MTSKVYLIEGKAQKKQLRIRQFGMLANRYFFFKVIILIRLVCPIFSLHPPPWVRTTVGEQARFSFDTCINIGTVCEKFTWRDPPVTFNYNLIAYKFIFMGQDN